jgi:hypothetical protein
VETEYDENGNPSKPVTTTTDKGFGFGSTRISTSPPDENDKTNSKGRFEIKIGPAEVLPSNQRCGPEQDTCADKCSIESQRQIDIRECMAILEGNEKVSKGEERPKFQPDPKILMPDPQTVGALKPEIAQLNQCLLQAIGVTDENKIVTQNDCQAYIQCTDFYTLPGQKCNCKDDPEKNVDLDGKATAELCKLVLCESEKGVCPCDEINLGGTDRPGGILPGTGPQPDPSPVMRLKVLGMPYSP